MDPGDVTSNLSELTKTEQTLMSRGVPIMRVFKLKGHQTGYTGHIINSVQDIATSLRKLPRSSADLGTNVVVVRRETPQQFSEFELNSHLLRTWLQYLKINK